MPTRNANSVAAGRNVRPATMAAKMVAAERRYRQKSREDLTEGDPDGD